MLIEGAVRGLGLAYVSETSVSSQLAAGQLELVLEDWSPRVPGFFLYFPSRNQRSGPLRALLDCARRGA
jgi:DNA-binding transcriptional LysR family regulator